MTALGWTESTEYEFFFEEIDQWMPCNCGSNEERVDSANPHRAKETTK